MGIFDFIREKGEDLFGRKKEGEASSDSEKAAQLQQYLGRLNLNVKNLSVHFDDGTATVHGSAASQADRERAILAVGNAKGVARVDDRITVDEASAPAVFYSVKPGDTLSKIAKEHYGDAGKYPTIFEANKPMLKDPDKIYPGQVLRIPAA